MSPPPMCLRIDDRDAVGRAKSDEGGLAVLGDAHADRLDRLRLHAWDLEADLLDDLVLDRIDDAAVPPTSDVTQSCLPSAVNSAKRGRLSTSTLATISWVLVSMKCAMFVVSDVLTRMACRPG